MNVRPADERDFPWLVRNDRHVPDPWISRCIVHGEYLVCERENVRIGFLRHSLFWGTIPYMDMIVVFPGHRRIGAGTALFDAWRTRMEEGGAAILMTSAETDETPSLAWHRRNGFEECGSLTFGRLGVPPETFLVRNL